MKKEQKRNSKNLKKQSTIRIVKPIIKYPSTSVGWANCASDC